MKFLKPKYNFETQRYTLDCRDAKDTLGRELFDLINSSITKDQLFVMHELPTYLIVTQRQFASLNNYTDEMYGVVDRMFKSLGTDGTIQCVMQVTIDREVDNVEEVEDTMQLVDQWNEEMRLEKVEAPVLPTDGIIPMH